MRAIVTGGAGFIGSNLVDELLEKGWGVIILDDLSTGKKENVNANAKLYRVDISTMKDLENPRRNVWRLFEGVDIVFHLAAKARVQPSIVDPISFNKINVEGTLNILLASHNAKVKRVVYSASSSAYGNALQKYIGEQYCKMFSEVYGLDTVSLRYFNIYGERMNLEGAYCLVMGIFAKQMKEGKPLTINNDGKQKRDFTYVGDAINANILAATRKENFKGDVFNIGNGNNFSINEVADMMGGEKKYGNKVAEPFQTLADNSKAMLMLDWDPKGDLPSWIKKYKKEIGI